MDKLVHYGKKFLIGMAIGAGVFAAMSLFGGLHLLAFLAPNPLTNFIYATLFFGAINTSGALMNDLFGGNPPSQKHAPTARVLSREPAETAREPSKLLGGLPGRHTVSHAQLLDAVAESRLER